MNDHRKLTLGSRRTLLKRAAMLAGAAVVSKMGASTEALAQPQKASKSGMKYQDKPNGDKKCSNCLQFIPGSSPTAQGTCKVVEGSISPNGYCIAWAKKP